MIRIPTEHIGLIPDIIDWYLATYGGESYESQEISVRLNRILDSWYRNHRQAELGKKLFEIEDKELYFLRMAVHDALDNISECSVNGAQADAFAIWLDDTYIKYRHN